MDVMIRGERKRGRTALGTPFRPLTHSTSTEEVEGLCMIVVQVSDADRARFSKFVLPDEECLVWTGAVTADGYGRFRLAGKVRLAHRIAWLFATGEWLPSETSIDHLCRNRACVNPAHLEPVSMHENVHRSPWTQASINAAKTHCPRQHPYDLANTYVSPAGSRLCRTCLRSRRKKVA